MNIFFRLKYGVVPSLNLPVTPPPLTKPLLKSKGLIHLMIKYIPTYT